MAIPHQTSQFLLFFLLKVRISHLIPFVLKEAQIPQEFNRRQMKRVHYFSDGAPVLCGGQVQWLGGGVPGFNKCLKYDAINDDWTEIGTTLYYG